MSTLERLFLFVKNLARQEVEDKLVENVDALIDNIGSEEEKIFALKMFLLICIMRRTHLTSQAPGVAAGASGEKKQLREAVVYFSKLGYTELVQSALRIIPVYGCWSDLRIIGEELYLFYREGKQEELDVEEFPVLKSICSIFAEQFVKDHQTLLESSYSLPSTAFKYCFHFSRHDNHRMAVRRNKMKRVNEGKFNPQLTGMKSKKRKLPDSTKEKNRQAYTKRKLMTSRKNREKIEEVVFHDPVKCNRLPLTNGKSPVHKANVCLSTYLASKLLFPGQSFPSGNVLESAYRNYFKPLRQRVFERKACLENFMCKQLWNKISFLHAPKGAVDRMKKALEKHGQKKRMLIAMRKNSDAIPNMEDIGKCIEDLMEEYEGIVGVSLEEHLLSLTGASNNVDADVIIPIAVMDEMVVPLVISKSIFTLISQRQDILLETKAIYAKISDQQDLNVAELPCVPVIDTMNCVSWAEKAQLVLAGYMVAAVNGVGFFYVDGKECPVTKAVVKEKEETSTTRKKKGVSLAADPLLWLQFVPPNFAAPASETLERLTKGMSGILDRVMQVNTDKIAARGQVDVLLLCRDFTVDPALFTSWLTVQQSQGLRDIQIHRVRRASRQNSDSDCHPFQPRKLQLPTHDAIVRSEITLDFLFVLDLTGSMQPYIDAARKYLLEIIGEVKSTTGVKDVRFAFVGYRDYCDRKNTQQPRFVVHDFTLNPQAIITAIQTQRASGGGDCPEDLLGGIVKAMDLSWQSSIRVMAIVTDAPQHGFTGSDSGDDHPDGRCPDQQAPYPSFPEAMAKIANVFGVDTLFVRCGQCGSSTKATEEAIAKVYPGDGKEGFGVLPMQNGANELKTVLCDGLSSAVNYLFSPPEQVGISTLEGNTLSALASSACQSLRQSIRDQFPSSVAIPIVASPEAPAVVEEKDASAMKTEEKVLSVEGEEEDYGGWGMTEKEENEIEEATESEEDEGENTRDGGISDYETLLQHLQQDFLSLAREALGLTVEEISENGLKLTRASSDMVVEECDEEEEDKKREEQALAGIAQSLLEEGVTYAELCDEKAPTVVLQRFVEEVKAQIERI